MNGKRYTYILIFIVAVIVVTLGIQVYWNIKNYEDTSIQVQRDLQTALDKSVEDYFTIQAKNNTISFFNNDEDGWSGDKMKRVLKAVDFKKFTADGIEFQDSVDLTGITVVKGAQMDTVKLIKNPKSVSHIDIKNKIPIPVKKKADTSNINRKFNDFFRVKKDTSKTNSNINSFFGGGEKSKDSLKPSAYSIETLTIEDKVGKGEMHEFQNRIIFSMTSNIMNMDRLDSIYKNELVQKEIDVDYQLFYSDGDSLYIKGDSLNSENRIKSESALFYKDASLEMTYAGQSMTILKRNLTGMLLSALLILAVISCLFYMLFVINQQKQLSLIKNDLISNITHEFKTPIATASAALEGVQNFTATGDVTKSNRYLTVGREQLTKLNLMVEKLLETAAIDSEKLALQKSHFDIAHTIKEAVQRYQGMTDKTIALELAKESLTVFGDEFHLENAINNLLDNAVKYGGDGIKVTAIPLKDAISIAVIDNGTAIAPKDSKYLFEKFYRVPQGDTHNVKGYGIGLFYTRAIIEKHGGTISLHPKPTTFKIHLPNE